VAWLICAAQSAVPGRGWSAASNLVRWEKTTVVAVKIKLKRLGKIREPYYRIVVADARTKRDGRAIEEIGKYHPKAEPSLIEVNSERVQHWLSVGAQPTDPVRVLLKITGDWQKFTGEPGAEGTLRTAKPRADKKEAFDAAAKESLTAKEAKESRSGGGAAKDAAARGKAARDSAARDGAAKDSAAKDSAAKDSAAKGGAAKDGAARPARAKGGARKAVAAEAVTAPAVRAEGASSEEGKAADAEPGSGA
jgi:small subunit ribosomal protein S16